MAENIRHSVTKCYILYDGQNQSDHNPVCLFLDIKVEFNRTNNVHIIPRLDWSAATPQNLACYKHNIDVYLVPLKIPVSAICCSDCNSSAHERDIQEYYDQLITVCTLAAKVSIPIKPCQTESESRVPGWNEHVAEHKQRAIFWHKLWKENGSPRDGSLASIRNSTRAKYHLAVKQVKAKKNSIIADKMSTCVINSKPKEFWNIVKNINGKNNSTTPSCVDNVTEANNIADLFASKYENLFNSTNYTQDEYNDTFAKIIKDLNLKCLCGHCSNVHSFNSCDVSIGLKGLTRGKRDGTAEIMTDHLIHCSDNFKIHIALLFTSMLHHGCSPHQFTRSCIIPIPKNQKKSLNDSNNYRAIALSNVLGKLFDKIILFKHEPDFSTSDMQFGFKKHSSTTICTAVLDEIVNYYNDKGSDVYAVLLDASKAFDRVHHLKLFKLLLTKGICPMLLKLLFNMYTHQSMTIKWNNCTSKSFNVSNGVKQGGVLSPVLFNLYIDVLLCKLKSSGYGCHIGNVFAGALGYADDIVLLSPTRFGLQKLLALCTDFADDFNILFNADKSNFMILSNNTNNTETANILGKNLKCTDNSIHLGNIIGKNSDFKRIDSCTKDFYKKTNVMLANFKHMSSTTKYEMFRSVSMALYGCQLWDFSSKHIEMFYVAWRKMLRRIFNLPSRTHCSLLSFIAQDIPVDIQLHRRLLNFFFQFCNSHNRLVNLCSQLVMNGSRSHLCNSLNLIKWKYFISNSALNAAREKCTKLIPFFIDHNGATQRTASFILDIMHRDDNFLSFNEYFELLNHLCCE